jgi:hypothetical protein
MVSSLSVGAFQRKKKTCFSQVEKKGEKEENNKTENMAVFE